MGFYQPFVHQAKIFLFKWVQLRVTGQGVETRVPSPLALPLGVAGLLTGHTQGDDS